MALNWQRLRSWEGLLLALVIVAIVTNIVQSPVYLSVGNQVNVFELSIEKIIVALSMCFIIINAEIDLSVASVMGLAACVLAFLFERGVPMGTAILAALLSGVVAGAFNGFWIAYV
ncbi:MAG: ABC transporter permease, partial [Anaerolineales bacterium]|nr:ABC transporter permease [Anaerolineales bacterium]